MAVTSKDIQEIKDTLKDVQGNVQLLLTNKEVREEDHIKVTDHEKVLKGAGSDVGLVAKVDRHDRWIGGANKVVWAIVLFLAAELATVILLALRGG